MYNFVIPFSLPDYEEARASYEQGLMARKRAFGLEHPETARTLYDLVDVLIEHGSYEAALQYLEQELAACETTVGEHHPFTNLVRQLLTDLTA